MDLRAILALFARAGQPVTPLLDGDAATDLDVGRLVAAGQKRLLQLRPDVVDGRLAIVQARHDVDVEIRSASLAPATFVLHAAVITHVWLLSEPVPVAQDLGRLVEGQLGGAAWRTLPDAPLRVPGTPDLTGSRPLRVEASGTGQLVASGDLFTGGLQREAAHSLLARAVHA